jgi:hypothetical protein
LDSAFAQLETCNGLSIRVNATYDSKLVFDDVITNDVQICDQGSPCRTCIEWQTFVLQPGYAMLCPEVCHHYLHIYQSL